MANWQDEIETPKVSLWSKINNTPSNLTISETFSLGLVTVVIFIVLLVWMDHYDDNAIPVLLGVLMLVDVLVGLLAGLLFVVKTIQWLWKKEVIQGLFGFGLMGAVVWVIAMTSGDNVGIESKTEPNYLKTTEYARFDDYTTERSYEEYGDMDCSDFYDQSDAQVFFENEGGPYDDYHNLDSDGDGIACESLF